MRNALSYAGRRVEVHGQDWTVGCRMWHEGRILPAQEAPLESEYSVSKRLTVLVLAALRSESCPTLTTTLTAWVLGKTFWTVGIIEATGLKRLVERLSGSRGTRWWRHVAAATAFLEIAGGYGGKIQGVIQFSRNARTFLGEGGDGRRFMKLQAHLGMSNSSRSSGSFAVIHQVPPMSGTQGTWNSQLIACIISEIPRRRFMYRLEKQESCLFTASLVLSQMGNTG